MPRPITPPIKATRPTVLPAVDERVYDEWKLSEVHIAGTGVGGDTAAGWVRFRKCRTLADGSIELGPADAIETISLENVTALAAQYPEIGPALEAVFAAAVKVGTDRGQL